MIYKCIKSYDGYRSIRPRVDPPHVRPKCGRSAPGLRSIRPRSWVVPPQLFGRIQEGVGGVKA